MRKSPSHNARDKRGRSSDTSTPKRTTQGSSRNSKMKPGRKRYRGQGR